MGTFLKSVSDLTLTRQSNTGLSISYIVNIDDSYTDDVVTLANKASAIQKNTLSNLPADLGTCSLYNNTNYIGK